MVLDYELAPDSAIVSTHGDVARLQAHPAEISPLWEATIRTAALNVFVMRDEQGEPVAIGSRMSKFSETTNMVTSGIILADDWLITLPGRGSLFMKAHNNVWPMLRDTLVDVDYLRRQWIGPRSYAPTVGPDESGTGSVIGVTGEYAGRFGFADERLDLRDYSMGRPLNGAIAGRLQLQIFERPGGPDPAASPQSDAP